jgi:hypothetical protein
MPAHFGTPEWTREQAPQGPTLLLVPRHPRKDGKYAVTYCFTARRITKLLSHQQLEDIKASGEYNVQVR